jgi:hypothetical protein
MCVGPDADCTLPVDMRFCPLAEERRFRLSSDIGLEGEFGGQLVMLGLQREQFEHDERFHREIARLTVHARLNHMALHFCKYTGQFATVCASGDTELRSKTITDSFIISLSSANILNLDLSEQVAPTLGYAATPRDLGLHLASHLYSTTKLDDHWLLIAHAVCAGRLARACEKIDHLEAFPFRDELRDAVLGLCRIALIGASVNNFDLSSAVQERRGHIRRSSFISMLHQKAVEEECP